MKINLFLPCCLTTYNTKENVIEHNIHKQLSYIFISIFHYIFETINLFHIDLSITTTAIFLETVLKCLMIIVVDRCAKDSSAVNRKRNISLFNKIYNCIFNFI